METYPALATAPRGEPASLLIAELPASCTPSPSYLAFLKEPYCLLLDSGMDPVRLGRYSYLTADPFLVLRSKGRRIQLIGRDGSETELWGDPFGALQCLLRQYRRPKLPGLPPFQGGAAGYFAYDLCHHLEVLPRRSQDDLGLPEMYVGLYDWVLAHDHQAGRTWAVVDGLLAPDSGKQRLAWLKERLEGPFPAERAWHGRRGAMQSNFRREDYISAIKAVKEYIAAGEVYQVNLSQRFQTELPVPPWQLYQRLRQVNPAPFAAYLGFGEVAVLSASPEGFLRLEDGQVESRPIKGTRPRHPDPARDRALAEELLRSEKDRAENVMIVDLLRNDLGKVCRIGSVRVPELCLLESHPTVFHLVSTITGELDPRFDAVDLLKACFPGGSVTGCPKIRSMEIIDELEPTQRGIYCGAIGYLGFNGTMNTNIVIRTMVITDNQLYLQVGGGIVADSVPEEEYEETLHKARGAMLALEAL